MSSSLFYSKLVGVMAINPDGSIRQSLIRWFAKEGKPLHLRREPGNVHDTNAIAADLDCRWWTLKFGRRQLGYLSADIAGRLAIDLDNGRVWHCAVKDRTGGKSKTYGVNIVLWPAEH